MTVWFSDEISLSVLYGIHIRALIVKIEEYTNKCTVLEHKAFTITAIELQHVSTFLGRPQGVYINICTKHGL